VLSNEMPFAPATQLKCSAWDEHGRALHSIGILTNSEYDALFAFFERVSNINLSIDRAAIATSQLSTNRSAAIDLLKPFTKAKRLIEPYEGHNLYLEAQAAIAAAITRRHRLILFWRA
jgi:hypothetical protein